ncbi:alpha-E domain-containing protein [Acinetobacter tianfuensis]|uniref:DUF403 domain-containing protein n=1 Tax=Acinetobacter tianfuensis TaxID=2419603 RepID=A0A3A8EVF8_9GAMM|nr:alpha-E domain-containing protein [Acinetobacter tianfuensis]RKG34034.1 hypothetical protein D7V32_01915 [Acinetobacter tianfuensis]
MLLLNSNAEQIFWLGRYLTRIQYLCSQYPFQSNDDALAYAHAFCLPAYDASSLNEMVLDAQHPASFSHQFEYALGNIQELRAVLSARAYAEMNLLIKNANENCSYICDVAGDCQDVLEGESELVFLFFSLGQAVEELDRQLRLMQDETATLAKVGHITASLAGMGLNALQDAWLQVQEDGANVYHFYDSIQSLFEADA